jgi:hypothetical protein
MQNEMARLTKYSILAAVTYKPSGLGVKKISLKHTNKSDMQHFLIC